MQPDWPSTLRSEGGHDECRLRGSRCSSRRTGVLVAGDSICTARDPYLHDEPPQAYQTWIDGLARLRRLPIGRSCQGPIAGIAAIDANIRALRARVGQLHTER